MQVYKVVYSPYDFQYKVINTETGIAQSSWAAYKDAVNTCRFMNAIVKSTRNVRGAA